MINILTVEDTSQATKPTLSLLNKLDRYGIEYNFKEIGDVNYLVIEIWKIKHLESFLNKIKIIKFPKNTKVIFYYPREGFNIDPWFLSIQKFATYSGMETFFVYSDLNIKNNYQNFINTYQLPKTVKVIPVDYFLTEYYESLEDLKMLNLTTDLNSEKHKDFLCYNGKFRPHRLLLVSDLYKNQLENNHISLIGNTYEESNFSLAQCLDVLKKYNFADEYLFNFVKNFSPIYLDKNNFNILSLNETEISHYNDTYFSVVTETSVDTMFLTEKTYKPIFNQHPFIILGSVGILSYLRKLGFETFPEMFDENYDSIDNIKDRYSLILENIISFCKLGDHEKRYRFNSVKHKLIYNKNHYIKLSQNKINIFKEIENYED